MNILVIAGEVSGDSYAAQLVSILKTQQKDLTIYAIGGQKLSTVADHFLFWLRFCIRFF